MANLVILTNDTVFDGNSVGLSANLNMLDGVDLNTVLKPGIYGLRNGSTALNFPGYGVTGYLVVVKMTDASIKQMYFYIASADTGHESIWVRTINTSTNYYGKWECVSFAGINASNKIAEDTRTKSLQVTGGNGIASIIYTGENTTWSTSVNVGGALIGQLASTITTGMTCPVRAGQTITTPGVYTHITVYGIN